MPKYKRPDLENKFRQAQLNKRLEANAKRMNLTPNTGDSGLDYGEVLGDDAVVFPTNIRPSDKRHNVVKVPYATAARYADRTGRKMYVGDPYDAEKLVRKHNKDFKPGGRK